MKAIQKENKLILNIDKGLYSSDVLHKCFYWYGNRFIIDINVLNDKYFEIVLTKTESIEENWDLLTAKIKRDLVDFKLRDIVTKETQNVRDLIIAKAFAYYDIETENKITEVSDPVGFNPSEI